VEALAHWVTDVVLVRWRVEALAHWVTDVVLVRWRVEALEMGRAVWGMAKGVVGTGMMKRKGGVRVTEVVAVGMGKVAAWATRRVMERVIREGRGMVTAVSVRAMVTVAPRFLVGR
jgi:hypothetical protein